MGRVERGAAFAAARDYLAEHGTGTAPQVAAAVGLSRQAVKAVLIRYSDTFEVAGYDVRDGAGRRAYVFRLVGSGARAPEAPAGATPASRAGPVPDAGEVPPGCVEAVVHTVSWRRYGDCADLGLSVVDPTCPDDWVTVRKDSYGAAWPPRPGAVVAYRPAVVVSSR